MRATRIRDRGKVLRRHEADSLLERPGDFVLVDRGVLRSFVMACPDGCGENITINLDPRADKAWRYYKKRNQISIFPSVWRDTGCGSHFIIWNHTILWCGSDEDEDEVAVENEAELRERVLTICSDQWQHYTQLAEQLDEVPWDINLVCRWLARNTVALTEGKRDLRGHFRLTVDRDERE